MLIAVLDARVHYRGAADFVPEAMAAGFALMVAGPSGTDGAVHDICHPDRRKRSFAPHQ